MSKIQNSKFKVQSVFLLSTVLLFYCSAVSADAAGSKYTLRSNLKTEGTVTGTRTFDYVDVNGQIITSELVILWNSLDNKKQDKIDFNDIFVIDGNSVSLAKAAADANGYLDMADWTIFNNKEPAIAAATPDPTLKYFRGDKSWQALNQAAVAGLTTASSPAFAGILAGDGTAAAPSYGFGSDPDTGFWKPTANQIACALGTTGDSLLLSQGNFQFNVYSNVTSPIFYFRKAKGTYALPTQVTSGVTIFSITGHGYSNASTWKSCGQITLKTEEAITDTASGSKWEFYTTPIGSASPVLRTTIDNAGNLIHQGSMAIGKATAPSYPVDVTGQVNATTGYRFNGTAGISETLTFGGGSSGDVNSITISGGIITGRTKIP